MVTVPLNEARRNLSDAVNRVAYGKERIVLTRRKKGVAVMVPMEDLKLIEAMEDRLDAEEARRILADKKDKLIPWAKAKKMLGL